MCIYTINNWSVRVCDQVVRVFALIITRSWFQFLDTAVCCLLEQSTLFYVALPSLWCQTWCTLWNYIDKVNLMGRTSSCIAQTVDNYKRICLCRLFTKKLRNRLSWTRETTNRTKPNWSPPSHYTPTYEVNRVTKTLKTFDYIKT